MRIPTLTMLPTRLFNEFLNSEKAGGIILLFATILSLVLANTAGQGYIDIWHFEAAGHTMGHWINEGLMTVFFLLIGLELEREIYIGELSDWRNASLPIVAAVGGMLLPAGIFLLINYGTPAADGAGIPMATDIAFAIGILSLLGNRVPTSLKIFLTALAVIDDLGAIVIIAVFYSKTISFVSLLIALGIFGVLLILNRLRVHNLIPYLIGGIAMWYFMLHSGVHPTITGVLLAFAIPFGDGGEKTPSYILQHFLHKPVAFLILPLFAMANTGIPISDTWHTALQDKLSIGVIAGLVIGKPLGIWLFSLLGAALGLCSLPADLKWKNILSVGFLGGIGFTMSMFITLLAFDENANLDAAKIAILLASAIAGVIGFVLLRLSLRSLEISAGIDQLQENG